MPDRTTAPERHSPDNISLPQARRVMLANGMPLIVITSPDLEIARLTVIRRGGLAEAADPAVALLASQLMAEGTTSRTGSELAAEIDFNGSWFESVPGSHHTRTTIFALPSRTRQVLPLLVDMICHPAFSATELSHLQRKLEASSREQQMMASYLAGRESARITFGHDHPLARTVTPEGIAAVSRDDIAAFHSRFCRPDMMTLFLTGPADPDQIEQLDLTFGAMPLPPQAPPVLDVRPMRPSGENRVEVAAPQAAQASVTITLPTVGRDHPDYVDLRLAVMALGGYFGSRLQQNIREERGLTYGIGASLMGMPEGAMASINTECRADAVDTVVAEVARELGRLAAEPPAGDEISRIRNAETTALLDIVDTPFSVTDFYQTLHTASLPDDYFARRVQASQTLTTARIAEVAARHLRPERMLVSVASPGAAPQ